MTAKIPVPSFLLALVFLPLNSSITYLLYYLISSICFVFLASTIQHELIFPFSFLLYLLTPAVPLLGPRVS